MVGTIKLFQFIQKFHKIIGIYPSQAKRKQCPINLTQTIFLICSAQIMFTSAAFSVFEAKSMIDYGFGFYMLISIINIIVIYLVFIWQSQNTLKFIETCEEFIEKSKYCFETIYDSQCEFDTFC